MTTPKDSKVDDTNTNQADSMRELIATQNQLSQETTQLLANNNGLDPAIQRILKLQSQLLQGLITQMINMRENFLPRANDNKDDKEANLEGTQASNNFRDKDHASKKHEDQCPKKRERSPTYEEHELEEFLALERPKKKKKCPNPNKKDITQEQCYSCKEMGHYYSGCPENKKNKEIDQVWCNNCKELGHYVATCPQELREELKDIHCFNCKNPGHYASNCQEKMKNKLNKPMEKLNLGP